MPPVTPAPNTPLPKPLPKPLRTQLENTVKTARDVAEKAGKAALAQLAVNEAKVPDYLDEPQRVLRRKLRSHARAISASSSQNNSVELQSLVWEVAYEHWHRMLFARFLAENNLLMWEPGAAVSLDDCRDMVDNHPDMAMGAKSHWELAGKLAARMLPQVFKPHSPVFELSFAPEHQRELERLLANLPPEVFQASDSLGWVYQFWQAKRKDEVNASEVKIGADELPAVTQLFTEPYMVDFLLHNSLGAWWHTRHPGLPCPVAMPYLRTVETASSRFDPNERQDGLDSGKRQDGASTGYFKPHDATAYLSGNLPHWRQDGVTYFVTFRCADSLPQDKLRQWVAERDAWLRQHPEPLSADEQSTYHGLFTQRIEHWLDQSYGECLLAQDQYRGIVEAALRHFDGQRYHLGHYVVMPNHVHVVVTPLPGFELSDILHSWKSFTANQINKLSGKTGAFWQKESFDVILRSPAHLGRVNQYIEEHPAPVETASSRFEPSKRQDGASTAPAAGKFEGWPDHLIDFKLLDPSCGSGHFLVAAFLLLVPLRMADEGLSAMDAVDAVLAHNLHGLEIDPRCVEIAVFALALAAWRYPDENGNPLGVRPDMLAPHIACCGLKVSARPEDWESLVPDSQPNAELLRQELRLLHRVFAQAPLLGSLLNPSLSIKNDLATSSFETLQMLIEQALSSEQPGTLWGGAQDLNDDAWDLAISARGLLEAARLLDARYHLVITNVPYLARGKQEQALKDYCEQHYPNAKNDLANVFLERCLELSITGIGLAQVVMPQNWLFLSSYRKQRQRLLKSTTWRLLGRLGFAAFDVMDWWAFGTILLSLENSEPNATAALRGVDTSPPKTTAEKGEMLKNSPLSQVSQESLFRSPDSRVGLEDLGSEVLLQRYASGLQGVSTSDNLRFRQQFWEQDLLGTGWSWFQGSTDESQLFGGCDSTVWLSKLNEIYEEARGTQASATAFEEGRNASKDSGVYLRGQVAWGKQGVAIRQMRHLPACLYLGSPFDTNTAVIFPNDQASLAEIWCFCSSPDFLESVRRVDQKLNVTNATMVKVPFDLAHWQQVAAERYPNGLPKPYSDDPTQWLFHGHPVPASDPLQVAVARLLGYRWPAEVEAASSRLKPDKRQDGASTPMELSSEAHAWIARCAPLAKHTDDDGIVCLPAVRGEQPAHERLLALLIDAWETAAPGSWTPSVLDKLLAQADNAGKSLAVWLRDSFFEQHAKRFGHRPFIWHVWDGQKDGFAALVNAHNLDAKNLERLIHTYLGDWIRTQEAGVVSGTDGAPLRLSAAQNLKTRLQAILEGEKPYDIFVRWKSLAQQPIGWNPDLNDGIRLNIRPFMTAEVLRHNKKPKLNITWDKDRGKDVESAPWFKVFNGERINDHHLTLAEKMAAKTKAPDYAYRPFESSELSLF